MKIALVNPRWTFDGSIYSGCRQPHLPLEYGYTRALLERVGHDVLLLDAHLHDIEMPDVVRTLETFAPDTIVVTTAPSYLLWRCAPPELRVSRALLHAVAHLPGLRVIVGPHASTTPVTTLRKLNADVAVLGDCEDTLVRLTEALSHARIGATRKLSSPDDLWRACKAVPSIALRIGDRYVVQGTPAEAALASLPALVWPQSDVDRHRHHHHRFEAPAAGPGAEMEASRGCPYDCTFFAKDVYRDDYRRRPLGVILEELDGLWRHGVEYVYFIDEIFMPNRALLEALIPFDIRFGVRTRIDLWSPANLELLGRAGCVSMEACVESITEGRNPLDRGDRLTTAQMSDRLVRAREHVPFVHANLLDAEAGRLAEVAQWRRFLIAAGVWANAPVPMFPYPGSPGYARRWGSPDDDAWERAMDAYRAETQTSNDMRE